MKPGPKQKVEGVALAVAAAVAAVLAAAAVAAGVVVAGVRGNVASLAGNGQHGRPNQPALDFSGVNYSYPITHIIPKTTKRNCPHGKAAGQSGQAHAA
jgi:hypothetical protein